MEIGEWTMEKWWVNYEKMVSQVLNIGNSAVKHGLTKKLVLEMVGWARTIGMERGEIVVLSNRKWWVNYKTRWVNQQE